jgi:dTMP kinase
MNRGRFVTFEGIEGSGKSTQLNLLTRWFSQKNVPFVMTREPGGTEIGTQIRKILLSEGTHGLSALSETFLYFADRFQHIVEVIRPQLEQGNLVLCDRYHDSTVAYQGYARKIPLNLLQSIWNNSGNALDPDLTLLFDIDPEIGIQRSMQKLHNANLDESRFEKEVIAFHHDVRQGFLAIAKSNPQRVVVLNANDSVSAVHEQVVRIIQTRLKIDG